jgi:glycosyltransferase involved in cell wall biosynthesis
MDDVSVCHVIAGLEAHHGGPSYSVPRLCDALAAAGADVKLFSVASWDAAPRETPPKTYHHQRFAWDFAHTFFLRELRLSSGLNAALRATAMTADVIHNHGLWLMPNVHAGYAAEHSQKPLVVSPRGMLSPAALAFSRLKKNIFWHLRQGSVIRHAACIHATSVQEYDEIRAFGLVNPVAIIANGIDVPEAFAGSIPSFNPDRVVLSLGRLHPKKGLDRLLCAWAHVEAMRPEWRLRIIGPNESCHAEELVSRANTLGLSRFSIEGPAYGNAKLAAYRGANLFVLPTLNDNFGLTVAEALAAGIPAISTKGAPWSGLEAEGCGWWIDHGVEPLAAALANATAMPVEALRAMGAKGRAWMARDFSWNRVARDMIEAYQWLTRRAEAPPTIRFD